MNPVDGLCIESFEVKQMKLRKILPGLVAALGMGVLILDSRTALMAAGQGVDLCLKTVIPSLFPFFVLSGILTGSLLGVELPALRPVGRVLGMPNGSETLLVSGFLGGYPVGAKAVWDAWSEGKIAKEDAERMLSFCSNAGPAFLFGMAGTMFSTPGSAWVLWGIHIVSALAAGWLFRQEPNGGAQSGSLQNASVPQAMTNAIRACVQVCGWVIAFRILCSFLERWILWFLPTWAKVAVTGLLELANGCLDLNTVASEPVRFLLCSGMLSLGGLSVLMQTVSVTRGLRLTYYLQGKLVQTLFSLLFSVIFLKWISPLWLIACPLLILPKKLGFRGSIPQKFAV